MDLNLLKTLAAARLPLRLTDPGQREAARLLEATGCITALMPAVHIECDDRPRHGDVIVVEVTPLGRAELAHVVAGEPDTPPPRAQPARSSDTPSRRSRLAWWRGDRLARPGR